MESKRRMFSSFGVTLAVAFAISCVGNAAPCPGPCFAADWLAKRFVAWRGGFAVAEGVHFAFGWRPLAALISLRNFIYAVQSAIITAAQLAVNHWCPFGDCTMIATSVLAGAVYGFLCCLSLWRRRIRAITTPPKAT